MGSFMMEISEGNERKADKPEKEKAVVKKLNNKRMPSKHIYNNLPEEKPKSKNVPTNLQLDPISKAELKEMI
jgi:hypothetical protein